MRQEDENTVKTFFSLFPSFPGRQSHAYNLRFSIEINHSHPILFRHYKNKKLEKIMQLYSHGSGKTARWVLLLLLLYTAAQVSFFILLVILWLATGCPCLATTMPC